MAIARNSIIRGPAIVKFDGAEFFTKDDITVRTSKETFKITTSMFGDVDERLTDIVSEISFTPVGEFEELDVLFPYQPSQIGSSIYGVDKPLVIQTLAGQQITFAAAALTRLPTVNCSAVQTLWGQVTFSCLGKDNESWTADGHRIAVAAQSYASSQFNPANIKTQPYTVTWGAQTFQTATGVVVDIGITTADVTIDAEGVIDRTLSGVTATARFQPLGLTEAQLLTLSKIQGAGIVRGSSLGNGAADLVVAGNGVSITLSGAQIKELPTNFGSGSLRIGELQMIATQKFTAGVPANLYAVAVGAGS